jgi:hypothetical protein
MTHHGDAIRNLGDDGQVMRDEQHRQAELLPQVGE